REVIGGSDGIIQGIRFEGTSEIVNVKDTIVSYPRELVSRVHWEIVAEKKKTVHVVSHRTGIELDIPRQALEPAVRTASGLGTMELVDPTVFAVVARFAQDDQFWADRDPNSLLKRRRQHLESRKGRLLISGRNHIDLVSE